MARYMSSKKANISYIQELREYLIILFLCFVLKLMRRTTIDAQQVTGAITWAARRVGDLDLAGHI
jgi:hypothetical protein